MSAKPNFWNPKELEAWHKDELLKVAWGIITDVGGGDWEEESKDWRQKAARWRDSYLTSLKQVSPEPATQKVIDAHNAALAIRDEIATQEFHKGFNAAIEANEGNKERLVVEVRKPLVEALKKAQYYFKLINRSGNFLGDEAHIAWTAVNIALAQCREDGKS